MEPLLHILSSKGETGLDDFHNDFSILYQQLRPQEGDAFIDDAYREVRVWLEALGHCEFDYRARHVYCCPPSMALLPSTKPVRACFVGARDPELINIIFNYGKASSIFVKTYNNLRRFFPSSFEGVLDLPLPDAIIAESQSLEQLQDFADKLNVELASSPMPSWGLTMASGSIKEMKSSLQFHEIEHSSVKKMLFNPDKLCFESIFKKDEPDGLIARINPITHRPQHYIRRGVLVAEVPRDWGRHLVISEKGMSVIFHDKKREVLAVPSTTALPSNLCRAATLCSGFAAMSLKFNQEMLNLPPNQPMDVYVNIPRSIAEVIASKLSQPLTDFRIDI